MVSSLGDPFGYWSGTFTFVYFVTYVHSAMTLLTERAKANAGGKVGRVSSPQSGRN